MTRRHLTALAATVALAVSLFMPAAANMSDSLDVAKGNLAREVWAAQEEWQDASTRPLYIATQQQVITEVSKAAASAQTREEVASLRQKVNHARAVIDKLAQRYDVAVTNGQARSESPESRSSASGVEGAAWWKQVRQILDDNGGRDVPMYSFNGNCNEKVTNAHGCADMLSGYVMFSPEMAGLTDSSIRYITLHELSHIYTARNWSSIEGDPMFVDDFASDKELIADCMAYAAGADHRGHSCSREMIEWATQWWLTGDNDLEVQKTVLDRAVAIASAAASRTKSMGDIASAKKSMPSAAAPTGLVDRSGDAVHRAQARFQAAVAQAKNLTEEEKSLTSIEGTLFGKKFRIDLERLPVASVPLVGDAGTCDDSAGTIEEFIIGTPAGESRRTYTRWGATRHDVPPARSRAHDFERAAKLAGVAGSR